MDTLSKIERLAARARLENPPLFRADASRIIGRAYARPAGPPTLVLCLSSAVSGLAACLVVYLALNTESASASVKQSQALVPTAATTSQTQPSDASQTSSTNDPTSALFDPLKMELP